MGYLSISRLEEAQIAGAHAASLLLNNGTQPWVCTSATIPGLSSQAVDTLQNPARAHAQATQVCLRKAGYTKRACLANPLPKHCPLSSSRLAASRYGRLHKCQQKICTRCAMLGTTDAVSLPHSVIQSQHPPKIVSRASPDVFCCIPSWLLLRSLRATPEPGPYP